MVSSKRSASALAAVRFAWSVEQLEPRRLLAVAGILDLLYVRVRFSDQSAAPALADPKNNADPFGAAWEREYGDPFCNMGHGGLRDWNATQKWALGFIGGTQVRTVSATTAATTTVTLTSHDNVNSFRASDVYLARVPIGTQAIYAQYRRDAGGVVIHVDSASRPRGGVLIDGNPATSTEDDAALRAGQSLFNPRGPGTADDIRVRVTSISDGRGPSSSRPGPLRRRRWSSSTSRRRTEAVISTTCRCG